MNKQSIRKWFSLLLAGDVSSHPASKLEVILGTAHLADTEAAY